jgi:hypothetical protein
MHPRKSPEVGLATQETPILMRSPDLARAAASLGTPRGSRGERRQVRIRLQFALLRLCAAADNRKNWLFVGSQQAGERAGVMLSLIESAKLNGHDPWAYLKDVFERLPTLKNRDLASLLPHSWKPAEKAEAPAVPAAAVAVIDIAGSSAPG